MKIGGFMHIIKEMGQLKKTYISLLGMLSGQKNIMMHNIDEKDNDRSNP